MPPQVIYTVAFVDGFWQIGLEGKRFGPYSSMDAAVAAASKAAHKAEAQGYEAILTINTPQDAGVADGERDRNAA